MTMNTMTHTNEDDMIVIEAMEVLTIARRLAKRTKIILDEFPGGSMSVNRELEEILTKRLTKRRVGTLACSIVAALQAYPDLSLLLGCWLRVGVLCDVPIAISYFYHFLTSQDSLTPQQVEAPLTPRFGRTPEFFDGVDVLHTEGRSNSQDSLVIVLDALETDSMDDPRFEFQSFDQKPIPLRRIQHLADTYKILNLEFPWFQNITDIIFKQLIARAHGNHVYGFNPLLLLGEPGIGKTYYLRRLAELSKVPWRLLALAGRGDNRDLAGTTKGWSNACPGHPIIGHENRKLRKPNYCAG